MVTLNTNVQSMNAQRLVNINNANLAKTTQRLSSGLRINSASDDPAGMGIAESLTSQIRGDKVASDQNIQQAQSMIQVADSALAEVGDILQRMRELAVQANNAGLSSNRWVRSTRSSRASRRPSTTSPPARRSTARCC
jgi:flagellin